MSENITQEKIVIPTEPVKHFDDRSITVPAFDGEIIDQPSGELLIDDNGVPLPVNMPSKNTGICVIS
jgi:hypothetical protein